MAITVRPTPLDMPQRRDGGTILRYSSDHAAHARRLEAEAEADRLFHARFRVIRRNFGTDENPEWDEMYVEREDA